MKKIAIAILLLFLVSGATAKGIGVSPVSSELGQIQRGETREVNVYFNLRGYDLPVRVTPSYEQPMPSSVFSQTSLIRPSAYSSQDITTWIRFKQESQVIGPNSSVTVNGRTFDGKITYIIDVPSNNAEPGYHGGKIKLEVTNEGGGSGFGASFVTKGVYRFFFRVPGSAVRDLGYESRVLRTGENEISVVSRFINQGTVTSTVRGATFNLKSLSGGFSTKRSVGVVKVPAGGSETVVMEIDSEQISAGNYKISGSADFMTGKAFVSDSFSLSDVVEVEPGQLDDDSSSGPTGSFDNESLPLWLVVMLLVMVGVLMYSFGIDPIWILVAVGVVGISVFILTTSVPDLMILLLLTITGALVYYGAM